MTFFSFLRTNKEFYPLLLKISLPIIIQGFVSTSLIFVDVLMIGQLGKEAIAAVGLGNQFMLIYLLILNGIASGVGIFASQYWGRRYVKHIRDTLGIGLRYGIGIGVVFTIITSFFSITIMKFYTPDTIVQELGSHYLFLIGLSCIFFAVTSVYAAILRSTKLVMLPLISSIIALALNTLLNFGLVLGHFGFPQLGVTGAGIALLVARAVECLIIVITIKIREIPTIINVRSVFLHRSFQHKKFFKVTLPVIIHSTGWVLGVTIYTKIYASIGTLAYAAINISDTLEKMGIMIFVGIGNACAIMLGNAIGAGRQDLAYDYGKKFLFISITGSWIVGVFLILIRHPVISLYELDAEGVHTVSMLIIMMASVMWLKSANIIFNGGILRSGGDTQFSMMLDIGGVWLIGAPLGILAAFYLQLPIYYVTPFIYTEELVKTILGFYRFRTGKWLKNLTE
ncbi:MAG: MATE family efflux transporter [Bacteroidales bacterium]